MRLLLATVAVSVAMLLLLARYRFPDQTERTAEPSPAPIERLAARATFDELASIMANLERRILPSIVTVAGESTSGTIYVPGVRLAPTRAIALLAGERRVGPVTGADAPVIAFRDAARDLVVLQTPSVTGTGTIPLLPATATRPGPRYIAVVETTGAGHAVRPVYIGRTDLFSDPHWSDPLLAVGAVQQVVSPGSAVFSLDGTFVGLATESAGRVMIVPAQTLRGIAAGAPPAPAVRADLPLEVQPLSPSLSRASGADRGVMVTYVRDPKAEIAAGDVIQAVDGIDVATVGGYQLVAQSRKPGAAATVRLVRRGRPLTMTVTAIEAEAAVSAAPHSEPGAVLRSVSGTGAEVVTVEPGSVAARAGLRRGDLIVRADNASAPDPGTVVKMFGTAKPGTFVLLTIRREGQHQVLALEKR